MRKRILAAAAGCVIMLSSCTAQDSRPRPVSTEPTPTPFATAAAPTPTPYSASSVIEVEDTLELMEDPAEGTEAPSGVNLNAVQNYAAAWNLMMGDSETLQLRASEAVVRPGQGMLEGGQVFEYSFAAGTLYIYVLEGHIVGTRMECHTNAWRDNQDEHDWSLLWKAMVHSVNGNWASSHFTEIVTKLSSDFMPAGQETGTKISELINDNGWVYQMIDEDLGYEYVKTVSCWLASFYGAAGRVLPELPENS